MMTGGRLADVRSVALMVLPEAMVLQNVEELILILNGGNNV